jgi:excisionase family DNA binding protein
MRKQKPDIPKVSGEPLERLITVEEAADLLRCSVDSLNKWRGKGDGPTFVRVGRRVKYRRSDLLTYVERASRTSTSQVA